MKLTPDNVFLIADTLPWESLRGGQYVKKALRLLIDKDPKKRKEGYFLLDDVLVIQSELFAAAFYLVPFLIALLESNMKYGKDNIYLLLYEIANGGAYHTDEVTYIIEYSPFVYYKPSAIGIKQNLAIACRSAVLMGMKCYFKEILDTTSDARQYCKDLIESFIEHSSPITCFFKEIIYYENDQSKIDFYNSIIKEVSYWRDISDFTWDPNHRE